MDVKALHRQMATYNRWKHQLDERLQRFEKWGQSHEMVSIEVRKTLQRARQLLRNESFTIACVGEFSRGKTELINALLYTQGGRRLLPSQPGRTTMFPTEIYCDAGQDNNCVRLLPIETRRTHTSLQNFKRIPRTGPRFALIPPTTSRCVRPSTRYRPANGSPRQRQPSWALGMKSLPSAMRRVWLRCPPGAMR